MEVHRYWHPVDPATLETSYPGVYAVGDVTSVGTPKAGVFAERQAAVVADEIVAKANGGRFEPYDGRGICYVEFRRDQVPRVDVSFLPGQAPSGDFDEAFAELAADKAEFGTSRIERWFGRGGRRIERAARDRQENQRRTMGDPA